MSKCCLLDLFGPFQKTCINFWYDGMRYSYANSKAESHGVRPALYLEISEP